MALSEYEKREVVAFCRQYPQWKKTAAELIRISSPKYDTPSVRTYHSDSTLSTVIRRDFYLKKIAIVEDTAAEFAEWKDSLIKNMCEGYPWVYLRDMWILPSFNKTTFFEIKKEFCEEIYTRKNKQEWPTL